MSLIKTVISCLEDAFIVKNQICEKIVRDDKEYYGELEKKREYPKTTKFGMSRVEKEGITLSSYINSLGFKKKNDYDNQQEVYQKVKELKKKRII